MFRKYRSRRVNNMKKKVENIENEVDNTQDMINDLEEKVNEDFFESSQGYPFEVFTENYITPSKNIKEYISDKFNLEGTWNISGKGLNVFYNQQPKTLLELKDNFRVDKYFNNYNSTLIIKQSIEDPRYLLCLATPDISSGVSYRTSFGYQPGFLSLDENKNFLLTIQDYDDSGRYNLVRFIRNENDVITRIQGEYFESGYNSQNRYQVPTCGAIELKKINDNTELNFIADDIINNVIDYKSELDSNVLENFIEGDYYYYEIDYSSRFKGISPTRYNRLVKAPLLNKNKKIVGEINTLFEYNIEKGINRCRTEVLRIYYNEEYNYIKSRNYSMDPFDLERESINDSTRLKIEVEACKGVSFIPGTDEDISSGTFTDDWIKVDISLEDADNFLMERLNGISDYKLYDRAVELSASINNNRMRRGTTIITKQVDGIMIDRVRE